MSFVSFATKKRFFHQITPKKSIVPCHSNWVMWPIKIFILSQGFLISTLLGYQNEFCVFCNQKTLFSPNNAKKSIVPCHSNWVMWPIKIFVMSQGFLISTLLGYQNEFCVFHNQKTLFSHNNAKKQYCSLSFKLGHVTYQNIPREPRIPNIHFTWLSKWVLCLSQPKNAFFT
jgi:hypothetical protein